jgi:hypothetical protein
LVSPDGGVLNYNNDVLISDMVLEGIIFDPKGKSLAIINGRVVKLNEQIGLYMVIEIRENKVVLVKNQERFVLEIKKEE